MHIKPPSPSTSPVNATPPSAKSTPAAGKGSDFAQMLKTAQAETPAAGPAAAPALNPAINTAQSPA